MWYHRVSRQLIYRKETGRFWCYTKKVDTMMQNMYNKINTKTGGKTMGNNNYTKYDEDFKKSLVSLHQNGKTQSQLCKEYGVSQSALGKWVKQYSTVEVGDGELLTAKQVKELQKRNAQLEEENLILKKAIAIFTPHSNKD